MFSFQIGVVPEEEEEEEEEEEPTSVESAALSDDVKTKLQEALQFLNQDIGQLVQDAEPIRAILKNLEGQLPVPIEALNLAAFIESHRVQVLRAQKYLADRLQTRTDYYSKRQPQGLHGINLCRNQISKRCSGCPPKKQD
jgi:hypothetical protein